MGEIKKDRVYSKQRQKIWFMVRTHERLSVYSNLWKLL